MIAPTLLFKALGRNTEVQTIVKTGSYSEAAPTTHKAKRKPIHRQKFISNTPEREAIVNFRNANQVNHEIEGRRDGRAPNDLSVTFGILPKIK